MNATEDGDEPVGEAPAIEVSWPVLIPDATAMVVAKPGRLMSIPDDLGENERQAIAEIRVLHREDVSDFPPPWCTNCLQPWPCETIQLLDKWGV